MKYLHGKRDKILKYTNFTIQIIRVIESIIQITRVSTVVAVNELGT